MGNESESTQKKKEKSENNEINEELKKNLDLFYRAVNCDPNSIEKICPVCFKSNAYDDIPKIASNKVDTDKEKEDFKKDYIRQIKANKIIIDEESVLKFDLERCNHFTCYSCSGGRFDLPCYFCQNFLTPRNIICFGKLDEVEEDFKKIICQFHGKFIPKKNQPKECKKQLLDNAKHFLLWHNDIIEAAYKKRMKEIEQMRKDFPKKYKSNYGITDEMIVDILGFADWLAWFTKNKDKVEYQKFINTHGFEFEVADLVVNHLDEVCLDDVVDKEE